MRSVVLLAALTCPIVAIAGQHGHSITGSAPVGAAGRAPVGAVGSLIQPSGSARSGAYGYHSGYVSSYAANPYTAGGSNLRRPPAAGYSGRGRGEHGRGYAVVAPFLLGYGGLGSPYYGDYYAEDSDAPPPYQEPVDTPADPLSQHLAMQQDALGQEIERLNSEIGTGVVEQPQAAPPTPPVTVVLRDGKRFQSGNYAIVNQVFWDFSKTPTRRVPLDEVNIPASIQASAADGAQFPD